MSKIPFSPREFDVIGSTISGTRMFKMNAGGVNVPETEPVYNRPISDRENWKLWFAGETPCWLPFGGWIDNDITIFRPRMNPDNLATHLVFDAQPLPEYDPSLTMTGWFGLDWVYVPIAGGATVKPGNPLLEDVNDWREKLTMPDLDALDWEGCAAANRDYLDNPRMNQLGILSGLWERLISLMDVDGAAIAMIDEDQSEALNDFFGAYSDFLIEYIRRCKEHFNIDCVLIHDDWGHQKSSFFSLNTAMEKLVPHLRRITDAVHELGMSFELHSCGKNEALVPAYIAAGVDMWCPQAINDIMMLGEKYRDQPITFGLQVFPVSAGADEEQQRQVARDWFDSVKDYRIINAARNTPPAAVRELYRVSREYYYSL